MDLERKLAGIGDSPALVVVDSRLDRAPADSLVEKCWASAFHKTDLDAKYADVIAQNELLEVLPA